MFSKLLKKTKKSLSLIDIDFSQSWIRVILSQKRYLIPAIIGESIYSAYRPFMIHLFGLIFSLHRIDYFFYTFLAWIGIYLISLGARILYNIVVLQSVYSIHYQAHKKFLHSNPIYHTNHSKGTMLGKVDRASRAYEDLLEVFALNIVQMTTGVISSLCLLFYENIWLGIQSTGLLLLILFINIIVLKYFIIPYEKQLIVADDNVKSICVENLSQINLIKTCFADDQIIDRLTSSEKKAMYKENELLLFYNIFYSFIRFLYLLSVCLVAWYVFNSTNHGITSAITGVSLLLAYLRGTNEFIRIEKPLKYAIKSITKINDLFTYIHSFHKTKSSSLKLDLSRKNNYSHLNNATLSITMKNISFKYNESINIFDNHTFFLTIPQNQHNKLYGLIGPSGIGKSTFVSILGGHIKPQNGSVFINGINVYYTDTSVRKKIIAIQNQEASNIKGTLQYNLLFGLPSNPHKHDFTISNDLLIMLLQQINLWNIFDRQQGLTTIIGEGGITLSAGQRQRINFINLYLRALFYKPYVILIDEPTSNLDSTSEQTITNMITSLAQDSTTFVITHKLQTITKAHSLIDFSLLCKEKIIQPYKHNTLRKKSIYYQKTFPFTKKGTFISS
jgi:ABC-type multidrug transport system fused ATPase/permease subunit